MSPEAAEAGRIQRAWRAQRRWHHIARHWRIISAPWRTWQRYRRYLESVRVAKEGRVVKKVAHLCWGDSMVVVLPGDVAQFIYRNGFYEEGVTSALMDCLKPGMTFIDIGAHYGYYTRLAAHLVTSAGRVHSFEPAPTTYKILQENTEQFAAVSLHQMAVYADRRQLPLKDYGVALSAYNSVETARLPKQHEAAYQEVLVETISIDEVVETCGLKPDFIKVDAESAEREILRGMEQTLRLWQPVLSIEIGDEGAANGQTPTQDILSFMAAHQYGVYSYQQQGYYPYEPRGRFTYGNLLFLPPGRALRA